MTDKGGGVEGKGDYSPLADPAHQQQQRDDYTGVVIDKGGGAEGKGDYSPPADPADQQQQRDD